MDRKELMIDLLLSNPRLTGAQAYDYAARIIQAEQQEDYITMHALIQEALYGYFEKSAA